MDLAKTSFVFFILACLVILTMVFAGIGVYAWLASRIEIKGGKVPVEKLGLPDVLVGGVITAFFILCAVEGFRGQPATIRDSSLISNAVMFGVIVMSLCAFMYFRGMDLLVQFGLRTVSIGRVLGFGFLLLLAAYPIMACANAVMTVVLKALQHDPQLQQPVKYFVDAAQHGNYRSLGLMLFTGVVIAPIAEEFIFRGYIYGVMKRYLGITMGVVLNAALFAAIHANVFALPGLFLLAVCLTLAYEFTGSILVNMCMHSLFNLTTFVILLYYPFSSQQ